jgi:hypothetical protein
MSEQTAFDWPSAATASVLAIGLMSGTSQDGVDVALIDTDGERIALLGATACRPYGKAERTLLRRATAATANLTERTARPEVVAEAERLINEAHGEAVESFLAANGLQRGEVAVIGFPVTKQPRADKYRHLAAILLDYLLSRHHLSRHGDNGVDALSCYPTAARDNSHEAHRRFYSQDHSLGSGARPLDGCRDELRIFESAFACNEAAKRSASLDECRRGDQVSETCALSHHALKSPCPLYPRKRTSITAAAMSALCHFRTSGDFIDRHFARDAPERRALRARGDAGILQQRRRLRIVDDRLAGEDRV